MNFELSDIEDEAGVYYVNLSATILAQLASWSSSLAPILASFILGPCAYTVCQKDLSKARSNNPDKLLTPYQLALILRF